MIMPQFNWCRAIALCFAVLTIVPGLTALGDYLRNNWNNLNPITDLRTWLGLGNAPEEINFGSTDVLNITGLINNLNDITRTPLVYVETHDRRAVNSLIPLAKSFAERFPMRTFEEYVIGKRKYNPPRSSRHMNENVSLKHSDVLKLYMAGVVMTDKNMDVERFTEILESETPRGYDVMRVMYSDKAAMTKRA